MAAKKAAKRNSSKGGKARAAKRSAMLSTAVLARTRRARRGKAATAEPGVLVLDVGGSNVKFLASGETEPRRIPSGKSLKPAAMVEAVLERARGWKFDVVSIGYPGPVGVHGPRSEPGNLGGGWVGFDFAAAFERPVRIINDAAMQALGSYDGGRMLFLGLGTGLGSAMIAENVIIPLELGRIRYDKDKELGELLGRRGLKSLGRPRWRKILNRTLESFTDAFMVDYIVLGGGNSDLVEDPPPGVRIGHNLTAFRGGMRLWSMESIHTHSAGSQQPPAPQRTSREWCVI